MQEVLIKAPCNCGIPPVVKVFLRSMDFARPSLACPFQKVFPSQLKRDDEFYMWLAYNQAIDAWKQDEVPIGAVIELGGEVIASAHNQRDSSCDPTAHAEILALGQAAKAIRDRR